MLTGKYTPCNGVCVPPDENFAINLKRYREEMGWSQNRLATAMRDRGWAGFRQTTVSRIEKGEQPVKLAEAIDLSEALDVALPILITDPELLRDSNRVWLLAHEVEEEAHALVKALQTLAFSRRELRQALSRPLVSDSAESAGRHSLSITTLDYVLVQADVDGLEAPQADDDAAEQAKTKETVDRPAKSKRGGTRG